MLTVPATKAGLLCATPAGMDLDIQLHARRYLPSTVPWISEDRLLAAVGIVLPGGHATETSMPSLIPLTATRQPLW